MAFCSPLPCPEPSDAGRCSLKVASIVAFPSSKIVTSFAPATDFGKSNALRFDFCFVSEVAKLNKMFCFVVDVSTPHCLRVK